MAKLLPIIIMLESFSAGMIYASTGKMGESIYWLSAAALNFAVVFLIPGGK